MKATFNPNNNSITIAYDDGAVVTNYFNNPTEARKWLENNRHIV